MRLTEKETNIVGLETGFYRIKKDNSNSCITDKCGNQRELNSLFLGQQKLGQLEDIEEKYGIDLIKFVEAVMSGYYVKETSENYWESPISILEYNAMKNFKELLAKDYKIKWALTREELE